MNNKWTSQEKEGEETVQSVQMNTCQSNYYRKDLNWLHHDVYSQWVNRSCKSKNNSPIYPFLYFAKQQKALQGQMVNLYRYTATLEGKFF